jgi:hypothetical protein
MTTRIPRQLVRCIGEEEVWDRGGTRPSGVIVSKVLFE